MFKVVVPFLSREELNEVVSRTILRQRYEAVPVLDGPRILHLRTVLDRVVVSDPMRDYACRLVLATHPDSPLSTERVKQFLRWGASPRAAQALIRAARVRALSQGRALCLIPGHPLLCHGSAPASCASELRRPGRKRICESAHRRSHPEAADGRMKHVEASAARNFTTLFDNALLAQIERMRLRPLRRLTNRSRGEHLSGKGGSSTDFADYRDYAAGDDLRYVDWNIFARLQRPYIKQFQHEEELHVVLLVDASTSMLFGDKLLTAKRAAAALGIMGLLNSEKVSAYAVHAQESQPWMLPPGSGRTRIRAAPAIS
ncbi:MAG UNVERIFIED_CONTAM: DUF58 domain-containing protein [Planctomycetaceae bacterium]